MYQTLENDPPQHPFQDKEIDRVYQNLERALKTRDCDLLEESLPKLRELVVGTRKHARLIAIAQAEIPLVQKEAENRRNLKGQPRFDLCCNKVKLSPPRKGSMIHANAP